MKKPNSPTSMSRSALVVDQLADEFETQWTSGKSPAIASFMERVDDSASQMLLAELVRIDIEYQWQTGDDRKIEEYIVNFPP